MGLRSLLFDFAGEVWAHTFGEAKAFAEEDVPRLVKKIYNEIADQTGIPSQIVEQAISQIARNPEEAVALMATVAAVPTPFAPLVWGMLLSGAMGTALDFALADERAQTEWAAQRPLVAEKFLAQWNEQKQVIPEQVRIQVEESIKYVALQVNAQWAAERELVPDKMQADLDARQVVQPTPAGAVPLIATLFRGIITEEDYFRYMEFAGYNQELAGVIKRAGEFYPPPQDLVNWLAKEVFEPEKIERYGLDDEWESVDTTMFGKAGVSDEQALNYWRAHWIHSPLGHIVEMFHRDVLRKVEDRSDLVIGSPEWQEVRDGAEELFKDYFRLVEVPPYWRDREVAISYNVLSRVDVRRAFDVGAINEEDVLRNALDRGYDLPDAKRYLLFVKLTAKWPDITRRFRKGWLDKDGMREAGLALGMDAELLEEKMQEVIANPDSDEEISKDRNLTVTDIIAATKRHLISWDDAIELLMRLRYSAEHSELKLRLKIDKPTWEQEVLEGGTFLRNLTSESGANPAGDGPASG